jgi:hypothetical protein
LVVQYIDDVYIEKVEMVETDEREVITVVPLLMQHICELEVTVEIENLEQMYISIIVNS